MKVTRMQLRRLILKEFYSRGSNQSLEGEIIDSNAWLRAFDEEGISLPRDHTYMPYFKIDRNSQYTGAWGKSYDALSDSGGPFAEHLLPKAIDIHNQMKFNKTAAPEKTASYEDMVKYVISLTKSGMLTKDEAMEEIRRLTRQRDSRNKIR